MFDIAPMLILFVAVGAALVIFAVVWIVARNYASKQIGLLRRHLQYKPAPPKKNYTIKQ